MEIGVPNSFIPHDATTPTARRYEGGNGAADLLTLLAIVLFVASGALAGGCFMYLQYLKNVTAQKQAALQKAEGAFDQSTMKTLTRLDSRMNVADSLLNAHLAPSIFFAALNQTTLSTVSFQELTFGAKDDSTVSLKMTGIARDINSVALQADLFGKSGLITNAIFSGIDQQQGGVHFQITGTIDPAKINYGSLVTGQPAAGVNPIPSSGGDAASSAAAQQSAPAVPAQAAAAAPASGQPTPAANAAGSGPSAPNVRRQALPSSAGAGH